ncbi:uncharacterized protein [Palaemon carinicauda]|uniref:uncharacterized protein n=1 Tax=Palaemon carinicauda TaxID=392227 RepID=UPI0035B69435
MDSANSREVLSDFIDLYQSFPCLWKIKSADYYNKHAKQIAQDKLVEKLKECDPNADRESCLRKINFLRASFRKEFKKVQASYKSGASTDDIYKPNLWYYEKLLFLKDQEMPGRSRSTIEEESFEREMLDETSVSSPTTVTIPTPAPSPTGSEASSSTSSKGCKNSQRDFYKLLSERLQKKQSSKFDAQVKAWAIQLDELPESTSMEVIRLVNDVLYKAKKGCINEMSHVVNGHLNPLSGTQPTGETQLASYFHNFSGNEFI